MAYGDLIDDLIAVMGDTWPEVKAHTIYQGFQIATIPLRKIADDGALPFGIIDINLRSVEDGAADSGTEEGEVKLYYVADDSVSGRTLIAKLEALRDAINQDGLTNCFIEHYPSVSFSMNDGLNAYFIGTQKPFYAGAVVLPLVYEHVETTDN